MNNIVKAYLSLAIVQSLHSIEEVYMHLYDYLEVAKQSFSYFDTLLPEIEIHPELFSVLNIIIITVIFVILPFVQLKQKWAVRFAWFLSVAEMLNGLGHIAGAIFLSRYVPGAFTAPLLVIAGALLFIQLYSKLKKNI